MIDYKNIKQLSELDSKLVRIIEVAKEIIQFVSHDTDEADTKRNLIAALDRITDIENEE